MFKRGGLLLVPYPFSDLSANKRRPVLALTPPDSYGDFITLPVTSRPQAERGVALTPSDLVSGSLPAPSWIRTDRVVTLNASLVVKSFGRASDDVVARAVEQLFVRIGLPAR